MAGKATASKPAKHYVTQSESVNVTFQLRRADHERLKRITDAQFRKLSDQARAYVLEGIARAEQQTT